MMTYLVRHGEALSKQEDPHRPLSEVGRHHIMQAGRLLERRISIQPGHIYHSPKARARQTASILSEMIPGSLQPVERDGLLPHDDPSIWGDRLAYMEKDVVLVGHLPHLSSLASLLLLWDPEKNIIDFKPGAVLCLENTGTWKVKWMISPDVLKKESSI